MFSLVPLTEPCALRSTQPLKVSSRDFSWGKDGRCLRLTTYLPCSAESSRKSGALTHSEPLGPPRPVAGQIYFLLVTNETPNNVNQRTAHAVINSHVFTGYIYFPPDCRREFQGTVPTLSKSAVFS